MRRIFPLGFFLGSLIAGVGVPAMASELPALYRVELPVADQSAATRARAAREGFEQLVQRLTGVAAVAEVPGLADDLAQAGKLVQSFGFREPTPEERALTPSPYVVQLDFDPKTVNRELSAAGLALWGRERPQSLIWLTLSGPEGDNLVTEDGDVLSRARLRLAAAQRGLPLKFPTAAAITALGILPTDVDGDVEKLTAASADSDAVVVAHLVQGSDGISGRARLLGEGLDWEVRGTDLATAYASLLDGLGERLARKYAVAATPGGAGIVLLHVRNVQNVEDYGHLLQYLQKLSVVKRVDVAGIAGSELELRIRSNGDLEALSQVIALGKHLQPVVAAEPAADRLDYQWMP